MEIFNIKTLAKKSGVSYYRLRTNMITTKERLKLSPEEKEAVLKSVTESVKEFIDFLG